MTPQEAPHPKSLDLTTVNPDLYIRTTPVKGQPMPSVRRLSWDGAKIVRTPIRYSYAAGKCTFYLPDIKYGEGTLYEVTRPRYSASRIREIYSSWNGFLEKQGDNLDLLDFFKSGQTWYEFAIGDKAGW